MEKLTQKNGQIATINIFANPTSHRNSRQGVTKAKKSPYFWQH